MCTTQNLKIENVAGKRWITEESSNGKEREQYKNETEWGVMTLNKELHTKAATGNI